MPASLSPSPAMNSCRPGHPPASAKARPAVTKVAVGHWLAFKAELEAARQGVRNECGGEHGRQPEEQVGVAEEEEVAERAHRAETAALREDADYEG